MGGVDEWGGGTGGVGWLGLSRTGGVDEWGGSGVVGRVGWVEWTSGVRWHRWSGTVGVK